MRKILLFLAFAAAAGAAQAQIKCWTDADGKRACGDAPPPGAKVTTLKGSSAAEEPAPAAKGAAKDGAKDAKKGPLTPAEQEQEYRKRQLEAKKADAKAADEKRIADAKRENCSRAREAQAQLEGGQRIMRVNPTTGERYFLEDAQIAQELVKARQAAQESCN